MIIGVPRESAEGEKRVALSPESVPRLIDLEVHVQKGAGDASGFPDASYEALGASISPDSDTVFSQSDVILKVQPPSISEARSFRPGMTLVSFLFPLSNLGVVGELSKRKVTALAMELMPRISRAQPMDALSSQSTVSGYKGVLLAADALPKLFPMLMTAAGTIAPAKVLVLGAGVAGLQAIATARRLGALVEAYDVRPEAKEQIESLGGRFVGIPIDTRDSQTKGGYARAQSEEFYAKQQALLQRHIQEADAVITTALVPGKKAPLLVSEEAVKGMRLGSVVVDLAAEQGGNCALTVPGRTIVKHGVTIVGPTNVPSSVAHQASQLYSRNVSSFLVSILKDGTLDTDSRDELVTGTLVLKEGVIVHEPTRAAIEGSR